MPFSPDALLRQLKSSSPKQRLEAARYFADNAEPGDEAILREAVATESVLWIKGALRRALARIVPDSTAEGGSVDQDDLPEGFSAQVYAEAIETTASQLMHEIEPLLGSLRLAAESELRESFETSETRKGLDRLDEFFSALSRLRRAASAPKAEKFSLDEIVQECIAECGAPPGILVQKSGPQPCVVEGDKGLIKLSFSNGLRNAIEATVALPEIEGHPIVVAWGSTDVDFWISVVDLGVGFQGNVQRAFDLGTTTKAGHLGMGLAIARQALTSMGGRVLLVPTERGVRFELRWPRPES